MTIVSNDLKYITSAKLPWETLGNRSVLITGANGFLPAYMVEVLLYLNDTVLRNDKVTIYALARNRRNAEKRFGKYLHRKELVFIIQDVVNPIAISSSIDYIVHAASKTYSQYYAVDPVGVINANILGTHNLMQLAIKKKIESFLLFSSAEVYGIVDDHLQPVKEDIYGYIDLNSVRSCYAEGKRASEALSIAYAYQYGIPVKNARLFHVYGPTMRLDSGSYSADFVLSIIKKKDIVIHGDGETIRTCCYVADAILACFYIMLKGANTSCYNVGGIGEIKIKNLAQLVADIYPEMSLKVLIRNRSGGGYQQSPVGRIVPDISRICELGWFPKYSLKSGYERTIKSYYE